MSFKFKKFASTIAATFIICCGIVKVSPNTKAMWSSNYYPQPGVPAYAAPVGYPQPGVPAYAIPVNNPTSGPAFNLPYPPPNGVINVPRFYKYVRLVDFATNRTILIAPITVRNGCYGYYFGNRFYVIRYIP